MLSSYSQTLAGRGCLLSALCCLVSAAGSTGLLPRSSFAVPSPSGPAGGGGAGTTVSAGLDWSNHSAYSTGSASAGRSGGYGYGAARSTSGGRETRERSGVGHSPEGDEEERKDGDLDRIGASLERAFENDPTISKWLKRNKVL